MKRIFLSVCAVAAVMFFMESCQKEVPVVDNTPSVISPDDGNFRGVKRFPVSELSINFDWQKMRVYADDDYIWMYFEIDETQLKTDVGAVLNVFFNSDNDAATGGNPLGEHLGNDVDYMLQGYCYQPGKYASWGPTFWQYAGTPGKVEWKWDNIAASGIGTGAGKDGKYELQIMRVLMVDVKFADTFTVGVDLQQNWASIGVLPNAAGGAAEKLAVTIDKK